MYTTKLTESVILGATRVDRLEYVKNLNVWGRQLSDVSILQKMPNLEVLSLSINKITTLKDFKNCKRLTELYLRKNDISDLSEVHYLKGMDNLKILWLNENPCSNDPNYRKKVISVLQNLEKLDDQDVTEEERLEARQYFEMLQKRLEEGENEETEEQEAAVAAAEETTGAAADPGQRMHNQYQRNGMPAMASPDRRDMRRPQWQRDAPVDVPFMLSSDNAAQESDDEARGEALYSKSTQGTEQREPARAFLPDDLPDIDQEGNLVHHAPRNHYHHQQQQQQQYRHDHLRQHHHQQHVQLTPPPARLPPQHHTPPPLPHVQSSAHEQRQHQHQQPSRTNPRMSSNVLTAVLALIQELDQDGLTIVQNQISRLSMNN